MTNKPVTLLCSFDMETLTGVHIDMQPYMICFSFKFYGPGIKLIHNEETIDYSPEEFMISLDRMISMQDEIKTRITQHVYGDNARTVDFRTYTIQLGGLGLESCERVA